MADGSFPVSDVFDAGFPVLEQTNGGKVPCSWDKYPRDAQGCVPLQALFETTDCLVQNSPCFSTSVGGLDDAPENGQLKKALKRREAPEQKTKINPKHKKTRKDVSNTQGSEQGSQFDESQDAQEAPVQGASEHEALEVVGPQAPPFAKFSQHTAQVAVPSAPSDVADLKHLMPAGGDASIYTVLLAAIAVAGGGAGWKFYQSFAKQRHEQRMKELEIKEKRVELQGERAEQKDDNHQKCAIERKVLEEKVAALEARLIEAEKRAEEQAAQAAEAKASAPQTPDLDFDFDEMQQRIEHLEKVLEGKVKKPEPKKAKAKKVQPSKTQPPKGEKQE